MRQLIVLLLQTLEKFEQHLRSLQFAQFRRVRRTDIDRDVIGNIVNSVEARQIIRYGFLNRNVARFADVDAQNAFGPVLPNMFCELGGAAIIKAGAIDEGAVSRQAEKTWPRIAWLRHSGNRADFNKTEAQRRQGLRGRSVLIKPRRQSNRI